MATFYSPTVVTTGLIACYDAANVRSYPGSGTSWFDLSGLGNTFQNQLINNIIVYKDFSNVSVIKPILLLLVIGMYLITPLIYCSTSSPHREHL